MEKTDVVAALAALAQDNRLDVFRLLVQAGPEGMPAGAVAAALGIAPNTLTFHFDRLRAAGLVTVRRDGRSMIYAARYETMNGLLGSLNKEHGHERRRRERGRPPEVQSGGPAGKRARQFLLRPYVLRQQLPDHLQALRQRPDRRVARGSGAGLARLRQSDGARPAPARRDGARPGIGRRHRCPA